MMSSAVTMAVTAHQPGSLLVTGGWKKAGRTKAGPRLAGRRVEVPDTSL
jgi:hypothetical protein